MSWGARQYRKYFFRRERRRQRRERRRHRARKHSPDPGRKERIRIFFPYIEDLPHIFRSPSPEYALRVCARLRRIKGRLSPEVPPEELPRFVRKRVQGRNYHHLTPRCRKKALHHGNTSRNLLLIRIGRHTVWHRIFGRMTLEEIVDFLFKLKKMHYATA